MFQRRDPLNFLQHVRQALWPKMGWWRLIKYYRYRVVRLSSSAESIAVNLAGGSALSLTPFFGIHIFGAVGFAWLIGARMNLVAATVGTFVGNPWTFPFFLYMEHKLGTVVMGMVGATHSGIELTPDKIEAHTDGILSFLWNNFADLFVPTAIGGTILAVVTYPAFYFLYLHLVRGAQQARLMRMKKQQRALFNEKASATEETSS